MKIKTERECSQEEKKAIEKYMKETHPSNLPKNRAKARWGFTRDRDGKLQAGLFL